MATTTAPPLTLRDPGSLQGQVPQVLYDYILELHHAITTLSAQNVQLQSQISSAHTVPLAAVTGGGKAGSITFNTQGLLTSFTDPT